MLVSSLNEIKSDELVIARLGCCGRNELVVLCDPSDMTNHKINCPNCNEKREINMKPVFIVGVGDSDWESKDNTIKSMKDNEILVEIKKIDSKFEVI